MTFEIQGLFIVGHARTGTTILLDALNTSPEILLFGESNFHFSMEKQGFRQWYNSMHRDVFRNPRTKSYHCPALLGDDATGEDYLRRLSQIFRFVGDKVAFRDASLGPYQFETFLLFQERYFYLSRYICTMRHPASTLNSCATLFTPVDMAPYVRSYLRTLLLVVELSRLFRHCRIIVQENVMPKTFDVLSDFLDTSLPSAHDLYNVNRQTKLKTSWEMAGITDAHRKLLDDAWKKFNFFYDCESLCLKNSQNELQTWQIELGNAVDSIKII